MTFSAPPLPPGRPLCLAGRGTTWVRETSPVEGRPRLLLLHGWTATADLNWFRCYEPLAAEFGVVAMDHRGHGRGIRSRDRFRLEDCADDAAALITALGDGPVIPVGYSMGGPVAQLLWRRHPELVAGMVLCATSARFRAHPGERVWFAGVDGLSRMAQITPMGMMGRVGERMVANKVRSGPHQEWARHELGLANPRTVLEAGAALGGFRSTDWIGGLDVPAASVITTQDRVVPTRRQEHLAEAVNAIAVHRVPGDHTAAVTDHEAFVPRLISACHNVASAVAGGASRSSRASSTAVA